MVLEAAQNHFVFNGYVLWNNFVHFGCFFLYLRLRFKILGVKHAACG